MCRRSRRGSAWWWGGRSLAGEAFDEAGPIDMNGAAGVLMGSGPFADKVEAGVVEVGKFFEVNVEGGSVGHAVEGIGEEGEAEEGGGAFEVEVAAAGDVGDEFEVEAGGLVDHFDDGEGDADEDAGEEVEGDDTEHGGEVDGEGDPAVFAEFAHVFDADEFPAGEDEDGGECGGRDALEDVGEEGDGEEEPGAVEDGGEASLCAGLDIGGGANDDAGHG